MADYTLVNLEDVEDSAPKYGMAGIEARFARQALELQNSGVSLQRLEPGFRAPFGHTHKEQEELYVLLRGSARVKLDDEILELRQWDAIRVPGATMRAFEAGPDGAELLAFGAPHHGGNDAELTPGWWTD